MTRSLSSSLFLLLLSLLSLSLPSSLVFCQGVSSSCATLSPVTNGQGSGTAQITYNSTDHTLSINIQFSGVTSKITNSHIHACTNNPLTGSASLATVATGFPLFPSATSGNYLHTLILTDPAVWNNNFITAQGTIGAAETGLVSCLSSGRAYINLHNANFTGGEISGFLQSSNCAPVTTTSAPITTTKKPSNIIRKCSDRVCANNATCSEIPYYPWVRCTCIAAVHSGVYCTVIGKSSPRITFTINKDIRYITDEYLFRNTIINEISVASGASLDRIAIQEMALTDSFDGVRLSITISPSSDPSSKLTAENAVYTLQGLLGNPNSRVYTDRNVIYMAAVDLETVVIDSCPYSLGNTVCSGSALQSYNSFDSVDDWEAATSIGVAVGLLIMLVFFALLFIPRLGVICRPRTDAEKDDFAGDRYEENVPHTPAGDDDAERAPWQSPKGKGGGKGSFSYQA